MGGVFVMFVQLEADRADGWPGEQAGRRKTEKLPQVLH